MLCTLALTSRKAKDTKLKIMPLVIVVVTGVALIFGTIDMPHFEDENAPVHRYPDPSYVEKAEHEIHMPNVITAVLASYRGYDTLGETTVIFTAGIGVMLPKGGQSQLTDDEVTAAVDFIITHKAK